MISGVSQGVNITSEVLSEYIENIEYITAKRSSKQCVTSR